MTDHHAGYIVVLNKDIREDDAEAVLTAVRMIKGVLSVEPIEADYALAITHSRVRRELADKLWAILYPKDQA